MTADNLPAELIPNFTSVEYVITKPTELLAPIYLFVVDTCVKQEEFDALKETLLNTIDLLDKNSIVGLITYASCVEVYDLGFTHCARTFTFNGSRDITSSTLPNILGFSSKNSKENTILMPLRECEDNLRTLIQELSIDQRIVKNDNRPLRATGVAVSTSLNILSLLLPQRGARIMLMMGGPCTYGPGLIVGESLKETIRSHHELNKESAKHFSTASKFYTELTKRAVENGYSIDLLSCSMDQTGFLEMRSLSKETGGIMVLADGFKAEVFQQSLYKIFEKDEQGSYQFGLNATVQVVTSVELRIMGAIGHMASLGEKNSLVSDKELGIGKTASWRICSLDRNSSYAFFFEVINQHSNSIPPTRNGMVQFQTTYQHPSGAKILKVTTVAHSWCDASLGHKAILPGFDQEAAAALMARIAVFKNEKEGSNAIRWIDKSLIQFYHRFCDYQKGVPETLQIPQELSVYHQFMFYLRRGPLIQAFNNSPDETVFFRYCLQRENVSNVLVMIQPTLDRYSLDSDPEPVVLSSQSVTSTDVLLLDTFFHVVVHFGSVVATWRNDKFHENPEYENVKELLESPVMDAQDLLASRLPLPMYVECDEDTSQARFLVATLDPTVTHKDSVNEQGQVIFTEDVKLKVFVDFLKERVVNYES